MKAGGQLAVRGSWDKICQQTFRQLERWEFSGRRLHLFLHRKGEWMLLPLRIQYSFQSMYFPYYNQFSFFMIFDPIHLIVSNSRICPKIISRIISDVNCWIADFSIQSIKNTSWIYIWTIFLIPVGLSAEIIRYLTWHFSLYFSQQIYFCICPTKFTLRSGISGPRIPGRVLNHSWIASRSSVLSK